MANLGSISALEAAVNAAIPDNTSNQVSPEDVRESIIDTIDTLTGSPVVNVLTGNTLWVDAINGNDSTGARGVQNRPFLTPLAAKNAASSGDVIIVRPGLYAIDPDSTLAKNGVNWLGEAGAILSKSGDPTVGIFDDNGSAVTCVVSGSFELLYAPDGWSSSFVAAARASHPGTRMIISATSIESDLTVAEDHCSVNGTNGTLMVNCRSIITTGFGYCVYWENGDTFVRAERIIGDGNGAVTSLVTATEMTGKYWVDAQEIRALGSGAVSCQSSASAAPQQMWVRAHEIISDHSTGSGVEFSGGALKLYVVAEKISCSGSGGTVIRNNASTGNQFTGAVWITAQKISGGQKWYADSIANSGNGRVFITAQHYEDTGDVTVGFDVKSAKLSISGGSAVIENGDGISIGGGSVAATGMRIDASASSTSNPVVKSGGALTMNACELIADAGQDSITSSGTQTVTCYGSGANTQVGSDVTIIGSLYIGTAQAAAGQVPTANADGSWSWQTP